MLVFFCLVCDDFSSCLILNIINITISSYTLEKLRIFHPCSANRRTVCRSYTRHCGHFLYICIPVPLLRISRLARRMINGTRKAVYYLRRLLVVVVAPYRLRLYQLAPTTCCSQRIISPLLSFCSFLFFFAFFRCRAQARTILTWFRGTNGFGGVRCNGFCDD